MKVKVIDVIKLCAVFLRLDSVLDLPVLGGEGVQEPEEKEQSEKELSLLLRCMNLVSNEIAADYFPLKATETLTAAEGSIQYTDFSKTPLDIYSVRKEGAACPFKLYPTELVTGEGEFTVDYTYLPKKAELLEELDFSEGKINRRIMAYGLAAEYCLICGMYEEAIIWDKRYKDSLKAAARTLRSFRLPIRRWL